jgi:hypothetical protein
MSSFRLRLFNVDGASTNSLGVRRVKAERRGGVTGMQISAMLLCEKRTSQKKVNAGETSMKQEFSA